MRKEEGFTYSKLIKIIDSVQPYYCVNDAKHLPQNKIEEELTELAKKDNIKLEFVN